MKSAKELSIMVLATPPESGRILSIRMSRFSGYKSGASTTGQRSWGKSEEGKINKEVTGAILIKNKLSSLLSLKARHI